jgi:hypothetical protein
LYYNILIFSPPATNPGGLCLVGQVENLRAGWQPALSGRAWLLKTERLLLRAAAAPSDV